MGRNPGGDDPQNLQHADFNPDLLPKERGSSSACVWEGDTAGLYFMT